MNTMYKLRPLLGASLLVFGIMAGMQAHASVVIAGTRAIYNAQEHEATLKISNKGKQPALTQAWIDAGDANASPSAIAAPFTVTPPAAHIDPEESQTLRILYTGKALPKDKESVFWLNLLEVPPASEKGQADQNYLQVAVRSRIKLFYRPEGLKGDALHAPQQLTWRLVRDGKTQVLEVRNPTAYHVSLASAEARAGGKHATFEGGNMVAPGETQRLPLKGEITPTGDATVHYRSINDRGSVIDGDAPLQGGATPLA